MLKGMLVLFWQYMKSEQRRLLLSLLMIAMLGLLAHSVSRSKDHSAPVPSVIYQGSRLVVPENSALRSAVHVEPVQLQSVVTTVIVPATVQSIPAKTVNILPPVTGQITKIFKIIGEPVVAGDPLYALVSPDLAQALATKKIAAAAYALAQQNLKRQRELAHYEINAIRDIEQAENDMLLTEAELRRSTARLQALHIDPADQDTLGNMVIRSPIDGVVTAVSGGAGTYWSDLTAPVMTVADLSQVYLVASAQEHDLPDFFIGQKAQAVFEQTSKPFESHVEFIDPVLNADTRTVSVGLSLDNADGSMRPNMFGRIRFQRKPRQRILLPITAVIQRGFDSIVFVEVAPWQFEPRRVKVGLQLDDHIEIESGLIDHERVAMTGGIILND